MPQSCELFHSHYAALKTKSFERHTVSKASPLLNVFGMLAESAALVHIQKHPGLSPGKIERDSHPFGRTSTGCTPGEDEGSAKHTKTRRGTLNRLQRLLPHGPIRAAHPGRVRRAGAVDSRSRKDKSSMRLRRNRRCHKVADFRNQRPQNRSKPLKTAHFRRSQKPSMLLAPGSWLLATCSLVLTSCSLLLTSSVTVKVDSRECRTGRVQYFRYRAASVWPSVVHPPRRPTGRATENIPDRAGSSARAW